jgi:hypothetical protein
MLVKARADGDGVVVLLADPARVPHGDPPPAGRMGPDGLDGAPETKVRSDAERLGIRGEVFDVLADRQVTRSTPGIGEV